MSTDATLLYVGLLFSSIGMGYMVYGRRQKHKVAFYAGLALIVYPYFFSSLTALVVLGILFMLLPRLLQLD